METHHDLFQIRFDFVFVAGIGVRHIPSRANVHFIDIAHGFASLRKQFRQSGHSVCKSIIQNSNQNRTNNQHDQNDEEVLERLFTGRPNDLLYFAEGDRELGT